MEVQPPPLVFYSSDPNLSSRGAVLWIRSKAETYIQGSEGRVGAAPSHSSFSVSVHDQDLGLSHQPLPSQSQAVPPAYLGPSALPWPFIRPEEACDGETLRIELHTWLTPRQSCLIRIIADPRMFSLKTDFSDDYQNIFLVPKAVWCWDRIMQNIWA